MSFPLTGRIFHGLPDLDFGTGLALPRFAPLFGSFLLTRYLSVNFWQQARHNVFRDLRARAQLSTAFQLRHSPSSLTS